MSEVSVFPTFLANLVTTLRATTGYRDPGAATADIPVFDGPRPVDTGEKTYLVIGAYDDPSNEEPITGDTGYASIPAVGPNSREETWEFPCCAVVWSGDTDIAPLRAAAFAVLATVAGVLRGDGMRQGISTNTVRSSLGPSMSFSPFQTSSGAEVHLEFTVQFQARI